MRNVPLTALMMLAMAAPAFALPTMIRIGYSECASCHISPQGGGPLNTYGRGIDKARTEWHWLLTGHNLTILHARTS